MNRDIIIAMCSHLCMSPDVNPYTNKEWTSLSIKLIDLKMNPTDLLEMTDADYQIKLNMDIEEIQRVRRLLSRSGSLTFEIEKLESRGISIITRADKDYPKILKTKLGSKCPPLFYYSGNLKLANNKCIGFVGSRNVEEEDVEFTNKCVEKFYNDGFTIVSGGAKGVDRSATERALELDGTAIEYLSDSMLRRLKDICVVNGIRNNNLLLLSASIPSAGFDVGIAMQRNKYIYCNSEKVIVVKSDYNKGGTWAGATEALKNNYSKVYCYDNNAKGNKELINLGALKIDKNITFLDGSIKIEPIEKIVSDNKYVQQSLFDINTNTK